MSALKIQVRFLGQRASSFPAQTLGFPICRRGVGRFPGA